MNNTEIKIKCLEMAKQNCNMITESYQYTVGQEKIQQKTVLQIAKDYYEWIVEGSNDIEKPKL